MGHQAGQGYCLQSLDPTSMSEGLIFLPVHMASRDSQHFVISHPTAIIFFFKHQNTLRYIHMQWPHFWVKERQRLGYPGLAFSWSTFCTVVPFLSSSLFYLLWFPSGLLLSLFTVDDSPWGHDPLISFHYLMWRNFVVNWKKWHTTVLLKVSYIHIYNILF